jgi:hypothetical protein
LGNGPRDVWAGGVQEQSVQDMWHGNVMAVYEYDTPVGVVQASSQVLTATRGDGGGSCENFMGTQGSLRMSQNPKHVRVFRDPDAPDWDQWVQRGYLTQGEDARERRLPEGQSEVSETGKIVPYDMTVSLDQPPCYHHLANFFAAVRGQGELTCPADVALTAEAVIHKTQEAVRAKQTTGFRVEDFRA